MLAVPGMPAPSAVMMTGNDHELRTVVEVLMAPPGAHVNTSHRCRCGSYRDDRTRPYQEPVLAVPQVPATLAMVMPGDQDELDAVAVMVVAVERAAVATR